MLLYHSFFFFFFLAFLLWTVLTVRQLELFLTSLASLVSPWDLVCCLELHHMCLHGYPVNI